MVQGLRRQIFSEQRVAFKHHRFRFAVAEHGDAKGMFKVVVGFEGRLHLKASVLLNLDRDYAVAPKRPNVAFVVVPPDEIPPVAVFLEEVGVKVVVRDRVVGVLEFGVAQLHRVPRTDGLQQGSKVLRATRVRGAFKLDELVHPVGFEVGRNGKAVRNFAQRLVELLKNGKVPELNQRVGREANGVEVVVVEQGLRGRLLQRSRSRWFVGSTAMRSAPERRVRGGCRGSVGGRNPRRTFFFVFTATR